MLSAFKKYKKDFEKTQDEINNSMVSRETRKKEFYKNVEKYLDQRKILINTPILGQPIEDQHLIKGATFFWKNGKRELKIILHNKGITPEEFNFWLCRFFLMGKEVKPIRFSEKFIKKYFSIKKK